MMQNKMARYTLMAILFAAPIVLFILICRSTSRIIYDENNFYYNILLVREYGFTIKFLCNLRNQSPGPLYQLLYYPLFYLGAKAIFYYRLMNFIFLLGCIFMLFRLMSKELIVNPLMKALLLFGIPLTWTTGGLALTEIPTFFFAIASCYCLKAGLEHEKKSPLLLTISGMLLGLTIIGRSPFLMVIPASAFLFISWKHANKFALLSYFICALCLPAALFYIWKGLVPPDVQKIQSGLNPLFLAYTFAYTCVFLFIIYPAWFKIGVIWYKIVSVMLIVAFLLNLFVFHKEYLPLKSAISLLPASISALMGHLIANFIPCFLFCLSILHVIALGKQIIKSTQDPWRIFLLLAATFIALTTVKSAAQFSTRYPYQSMPFLLLYCAPWIRLNMGLAFRITIGIILGIISLTGYYQLHYT